MTDRVRVFIKFLFFIGFITSYASSAALIVAFYLFSFQRARNFLIKNISLHSRIAIYLFGIKLRSNGKFPNDENYLIVSNHLSYVDIFVISYFVPTCFVTSYEMKETPFLGQLCSLGGCLFVERRSKRGIHNEVKNLTHALKKNFNVTIFPEGTTGNGECLLKFRRPLFQAAIDSNKKVLPICINYKAVNGKKIDYDTRDKVYWYGDVSFISHLIKFLSCKEVEVQIDICSAILSDDKIVLAEKSFEQINQIYISV